MVRDLLDQTLGFQILQSLTGDGAVDAQAINQNTDSDELVSGDFLHHLVVGGLVHEDGVFSLLLGLSLRPLLLLSFSTSRSFSSRSLLRKENDLEIVFKKGKF